MSVVLTCAENRPSYGSVSSTIQASAPEIDQSKALKSPASKPSNSIAFPGWPFPPTGLGETSPLPEDGLFVGRYDG